jgi:C1A family cysteine protease
MLFAFFATLISNAQGLNFSSNEQISKYDKYDFESKGFATAIPPSYSLEKYVPPILQQDGGTCVGYATLYYGLSTMYNYKLDITSNSEKFAYAFDPYFIYSQINKSSNCERGLVINESFDLQSQIGAKKMFYPLFLNCDSSFDDKETRRVIKYTSAYKIKNYYYLNPKDVNFIKYIKQNIYGGFPVVVGAQLKKSFQPYNSKSNLSGVKIDGLWKPKPDEKPNGGHAMCVIAYDDVKFGGCFKLANSWGFGYGAQGYVYIKYIDFKKAVKEAFVFDIDDYQNPTIDYQNYKRFSFSDPKFKNHIYEGEINDDNRINGYGIYSIDHKYFLIGKFDNGIRNGPFITIDEKADKLITVYEYENDQIIKKIIGFANNSENKSIIDFTKYIKKVIPNQKVIVSDESPELDIATKK